MNLTYTLGGAITPNEAASLLRETNFLRPLDDPARVQRMIDNADVLITARDGSGVLAGFVRALTDFAFYCLVAEIAVSPDHQGKGIGRELLRRLREATGDQVNMVLNASESGDTFYGHLGWEKLERGWRLRRTR